MPPAGTFPGITGSHLELGIIREELKKGSLRTNDNSHPTAPGVRSVVSPPSSVFGFLLAHPVFAYWPDPGTPPRRACPGAFDRQVSRKARRKARPREEAVQGEGREVALVPRNRRQHQRWRSGVAILRVRKKRNRTPAEEDLKKAARARTEDRRQRTAPSSVLRVKSSPKQPPMGRLPRGSAHEPPPENRGSRRAVVRQETQGGERAGVSGP